MNHASSCRNTRLPLVIILTLAATFLLTGTCLAQGTFVSFDGPNAGVKAGNGTFPTAMNRLGGIALVTIDSNLTSRAYVRHHRNGSYLQIQPPNAISTSISGLNSKGQVAGTFYTGSQRFGYVRDVDGTYVILNPPGAIGVNNVVGINEAGQVAGTAHLGATGTPFFWDPAHPDTYVTFSVPGGAYVYATAMNDSGQIAGLYNDS
jgi:uncharacterized membrane protein